MQKQENQPQKSNIPIQGKNKNFFLVLILGSILLTGSGVYFYQQIRYKNLTSDLKTQLEQVRSENAMLKITLESLERTTWETDIGEDQEVVDTTTWQTTNIIGLSIKHPLDSSVREPQLTADIDIRWNGNKHENQELVDGWIIGITYTYTDLADYSSRDMAFTWKEGIGKYCTSSSVNTIEIDNTKEAYYYSTDCPSRESGIHYFVTSNTYHYIIQASYIGKDKQLYTYKAVVEEIISRIIF